MLFGMTPIYIRWFGFAKNNKPYKTIRTMTNKKPRAMTTIKSIKNCPSSRTKAKDKMFKIENKV